MSGVYGREIGRLSFFRAWRISPVRGWPAKSRFIFRAGPDTHGCVYEKTLTVPLGGESCL